MTEWAVSFMFWMMVFGECGRFLFLAVLVYAVFMGALYIRARIKRRK